MKIQFTLFFFILFSISVIGQTVQPLENRDIQAVKSTNSRNLPSQTSCGYILEYSYDYHSMYYEMYYEMYRVLKGIKASEYIDNSDCNRFGNLIKHPNQLAKTPELEPDMRSFSFLDLSR